MGKRTISMAMFNSLPEGIWIWWKTKRNNQNVQWLSETVNWLNFRHSLRINATLNREQVGIYDQASSVEFKKLGIQIGPYNTKVRTTSAKLLVHWVHYWLMVGEAGARWAWPWLEYWRNRPPQFSVSFLSWDVPFWRQYVKQEKNIRLK